ncbi:MAG: DUF1285 domain-containing protein [Bradymonadaceae bacterium]
MTHDEPGFLDDGTIDDTLPDIVQEFLESGADLEEIRLDARGEWTHEGLDFENQKIIDLFNRSVDRTDGGTWVLEVGRFTYPITVEDTGFFVEQVDLETSPPLLRLSDGTTETLDPDTLEYESGGRLYCRVKNGEFRARFKRPAYYDLADRCERQDGGIYLELDDRRVRLASVDQLDESG